MMRSLASSPLFPDRTRVFCGHEYTEKNLQFALTLEPGNAPLAKKMGAVEALRRAGKPTVPSTIAEEKATNPFLRTGSAELAATVRARVPGSAGERSGGAVRRRSRVEGPVLSR